MHKIKKFYRLFNEIKLLEKVHASFSQFETKRQFIDYAFNSFEAIDKSRLISSLCRGKDVLDVGCIDHSYQVAMNLGDRWLHKQIKEVSQSLVGLDILEEDAKQLNTHGYNIMVANAESFDLGRKFDVVVVGDLIEHLGNIGSFLTSLEKHLHKDSIVIITTPNPFNIEQTMLCFFEGQTIVNDEHTVWIDPKVMYELIQRSNLRIVDFYWVETRFKLHINRKIIGYLANGFCEALMRIRPVFRRDYAIVVTLG